MTRRPFVRDRRAALIGGLLLAAGGAFLLYDAYDARGRRRPYLLRVLPGA